MNELLLAGLVLVAALACPAHMWWAHRRGRRAACCPPRQGGQRQPDLAALQARRRQVEAQLAEFDLGQASEPVEPRR
jgi:hypothetical protein